MAFWSCDSLTNVSIPSSVTSIGDYAFGYCVNLTSFFTQECNQTIKIGKDIFVGCCSLGNVTIPNIEHIEDNDNWDGSLMSYEDMYRDAFCNMPDAEWNID